MNDPGDGRVPTRLSADARRVLAHITAQRGNGATLEEVEVGLGLEHAEAAAHLARLLAVGVVEASGMVRLNRLSRLTNVYIATEG
jgi:hypothetical protein